MEQNKRGGKREGAGRKPLPITQKKTVLTLYPTNADLIRFGGKVKLQEEILKFIAYYGKEGVQDLTKPNVEVKPIEQPKSNYQVNTQPALQEPIKAFKTAAQYMKEKREIETPEEYQKWLAELEADQYLGRKQKDLIKSTNPSTL